MAKDESKRLNPALVESDKTSFAALQAISNYAPANPTYAMAAITTAQTELTAAQQAEAQAAAAAATARDNAVAKEWAFHNLVLGARDQVVAQFGRDSTEVQAVGLKRVSEFKTRQRKPKTPSA
ncbi:MAG TPA: hypothetical protein VGN95_11420 [Pyrinomonadaceae bacterium]|jgi:hypothetical protein|nr:hypothetical protein [Pyrinomonadaceae bacterium]